MRAVYRAGPAGEWAFGRWAHLALGPLIAPASLRPYLRAVARGHVWMVYLPGALEHGLLPFGVTEVEPPPTPLPRSLELAALAGTPPATVCGRGARFGSAAVAAVHDALASWDAATIEAACEREREHLAGQPAGVDIAGLCRTLADGFGRARSEGAEVMLTWE